MHTELDCAHFKIPSYDPVGEDYYICTIYNVIQFDIFYLSRVLSIRSGPMSGLKVSVQKCSSNKIPSPLTDSKWADLGGHFEPVHMDRIEGKNVVNKMELLMACLSQEHN